MKQRLLTGIGIVAMLIVALVMRTITPYIFDLFIGLIGVYSICEMTKLLSKRGMYNNKFVPCIYFFLSYTLFVVCIVSSVALYMVLVYQIALLVATLLVQYLTMVILKKNTLNEIKTRKLNISNSRFAITKALNTCYACVYPALLFMLFIFINHLQDMQIQQAMTTTNYFALFMLVLAFTIPILADTFAYLIGSLLGGKKLFPTISPKKTISGAVGGIVWAIIGAVCVYLIFNAFNNFNDMLYVLGVKYWHFIIVGFISAIVCILGDLFESYLKRKANVKDSGEIFPGHGGFLDRFDSHLLNIVVMVVYALIILL